jgi:thiopeptide-type bacteriocin biosynthesis protein
MTLYDPLDFAVVRAPLLPVDTLDALTDGDNDLRRVLSSDARAALAVASTTFSGALAKDGAGQLRPRTESTLRRYLIRMSTRPTPLGLFAAVGLAGWGEHTDIELAADHRPRRTRPDAAWLMALVDRAESHPEILRRLHVRANPLALRRAGRVFLAERAGLDSGAPQSVSVRDTEVVQRAMATARTPIRFDDMSAHLLRATPGATLEQVTTLLVRLCEQTFLLTDLRAPLTVASPARHVLEKLGGIPAAAQPHEMLASVLDAADRWDAQPSPDETGFRKLVAGATGVVAAKDPVVQVDSALTFTSATLSRHIAADAARAAELLLRMSPIANGPAALEAYRRAFEHRYGLHREVPLGELVDPHVGIGPLPFGSPGATSASSAKRDQALVDMAVWALQTRSREVQLDDAAVARLATGDTSANGIPASLDLVVVVAAASREAIDAGEYDLAVGPTVGSAAAGRMLGRFADFVPGASQALAQVAAAEAERTPGWVVAELVYQPRTRRLGNVSVRPNLRGYEIPVDLSASTDADHTIGVDELVVGVRDGRFQLRWTRTGEGVMVTAGHMLTSMRAPAAARFLSEVGRHRTRQLGAFSWGPAASFPFLPRVRCGRIVLSLAQWRLRADSFSDKLADPLSFRTELDAWRERWDAPAALVVAAGDHRLPLDLTRPGDAEELRRTLRSRDSVVVQERFPHADRTWLTDTAGRRFAAEFVVPLIRRSTVPAPPATTTPGSRADLRPPGSDWLFVKVYCASDMETELLTGPVRALVHEGAVHGFTDWFFIRYSDPRRHIRLRFRGEPARLLSDLLPRVTAWATELLSSGMCQSFSIDTYDRELDRFGGPHGVAVAEDFFCTDSAAVSDLLASCAVELLPAAVMTVDAILAGFGLSRQQRATWCAAGSGPRRESGADYRAWKQLLRPMLAGECPPQPPAAVLARFRTAAARLRSAAAELHDTGRLSHPPAYLHGSLVHLHLNRLMGADRPTERRVYGLSERLQRSLTLTTNGSAHAKR